MKIVMINGSPKAGESNSGIILEQLKKQLGNSHEINSFNVNEGLLSKEEYDVFKEVDALIFAFPLYLDGMPAHLLGQMVELENYFKTYSHKQMLVYAVINCGFFEGIQNELAIELVKNWCKKAGLVWGQGLGIGAGRMVGQLLKSKPIGKGPLTTLGKKVQTLSENIVMKRSGEPLYCSPNCPKILFKLIARKHMSNGNAK